MGSFGGEENTADLSISLFARPEMFDSHEWITRSSWCDRDVEVESEVDT